MLKHNPVKNAFKTSTLIDQDTETVSLQAQGLNFKVSFSFIEN